MSNHEEFHGVTAGYCGHVRVRSFREPSIPVGHDDAPSRRPAQP